MLASNTMSLRVSHACRVQKWPSTVPRIYCSVRLQVKQTLKDALSGDWVIESVRIHHARGAMFNAYLDGVLDWPSGDARLNLSMDSTDDSSRQRMVKAEGIADGIHFLTNRNVR
jgi:hypothetical protein